MSIGLGPPLAERTIATRTVAKISPATESEPHHNEIQRPRPFSGNTTRHRATTNAPQIDPPPIDSAMAV